MRMDIKIGDTVQVVGVNEADYLSKDDGIIGNTFKVVNIDKKSKFPITLSVFGTWLNFQESEVQRV